MNSRNKGVCGEREWRDQLRAEGYDARRGQQFSGGPDSPDVICPSLPWLHWEVKRVEKLNLLDATVKAEADSGGKPWAIAHRRNHGPWMVTVRKEFFFQLLRQFDPNTTTQTKNTTQV